MGSAVVITITVLAAVLIIILSSFIMRLVYEKRFRDWRDEAISHWQAEIGQARKTAVEQSRAVLGGRFTEQMVPFFPDFRYDPTEVRFIGSPIDLIAFPGLSVGDPREIVILEVKTGKNPQLTPAQKKIRQLIEDGMVRWDEIHREGEGEGEGESTNS